MRTKLTTTILFALLATAGGPAIATDDGTWHGGGEGQRAGASSSSFCVLVGEIAGEGLQGLCSAMVE